MQNFVDRPRVLFEPGRTSSSRPSVSIHIQQTSLEQASLAARSRTDELLSSFAVHFVFPVAFFAAFVEHQSIGTSFGIVHRCLTLMKDIAESSIRIVSIRLEGDERRVLLPRSFRSLLTRRLQKFSLIPSHM